jgi:hypothetical protein
MSDEGVVNLFDDKELQTDIKIKTLIKHSDIENSIASVSANNEPTSKKSYNTINEPIIETLVTIP